MSTMPESDLPMTIEEFREEMSKPRWVRGGALAAAFETLSERARMITAELNGSYHTLEENRELFARLTARPLDEGFRVFPPFYTDCGVNTQVGQNVFINACCNFQDQGGIRIGDEALIGHSVVFATLNHDLDPEHRQDMYAKPIIVGNRVWIGSHATILSGVTIGDDAVVAAGAVVTRDVPARAVVGGIPAKYLRDIPDTSERQQ